MYKQYLKPLFDKTLSFILLIVVSPLILIIILISFFCLGTPIFYKQIRPGKNGEPFTIYKFRTMTLEKDPDGNLLPDSERLTRYGKFLRKTSLDELPELLNVLKGEMSLVGPRPLLMEYLERYNKEQFRRHEVKPGITGWAQVNGRNDLSWDKKFELDVWYIDNQSVYLDIKILFKTLYQVVKRNGINAFGNATMPKFQGNQEIN